MDQHLSCKSDVSPTSRRGPVDLDRPGWCWEGNTSAQLHTGDVVASASKPKNSSALLVFLVFPPPPTFLVLILLVRFRQSVTVKVFQKSRLAADVRRYFFVADGFWCMVSLTLLELRQERMRTARHSDRLNLWTAPVGVSLDSRVFPPQILKLGEPTESYVAFL